jgi:hypothetical protein
MGEASMRTTRTALAALAAMTLLVPAAHAATIEGGVVGLKLILLDKYSLGKAKAVYVAKGDPDIIKGMEGDPPGLTGTVQIIDLSDPSNQAVYSLPGSGWLVNKATVAKYVNKLAAPGGDGVKVAVVKPGLVGKVVAKNLGDGDSASGDQGASDLNLQDFDGSENVRVVVTIVNSNDGNTYVFCSDFNTLSVKLDNASQPFKVISKSSTAPGSCAVGPTTTTTSTTSTTTTTLGGACCGPTRDQLSFTTAPGVGTCGTVTNSLGTNILNLNCGGLYIGGGLNSVPPALIPDLGQSITNVTSCNSGTGALVLGATTSGQTGSIRNCTSPGCLFGAPLPIANPGSPPTSTCVINSVATAASGTANCNTGDSAINIPLNSQIYLTGDLLAAPGIQPCPLCTGGFCQGGPNDTLACSPGTTALDASYPTSHDCPPPPGTDIGGLPIGFALTSGSTTRTAVPNGTQQRVFCGFCRDQTALGTGTFENPANPCNTNADCTDPLFPDCEQRDNGAFGPPSGGSAKTIVGTGSPAGDLTDGASHPAKLVSIFCIPPTFNATVDAAADLPGPGFSALQGNAQLQ